MLTLPNHMFPEPPEENNGSSKEYEELEEELVLKGIKRYYEIHNERQRRS